MTNCGAEGKRKQGAEYLPACVAGAMGITEMRSLVKGAGLGNHTLIFKMQTHSKFYSYLIFTNYFSN